MNSSACGAAYQDLIAYEYEHGCFNRHSPQAYAVQHPPHALLQQQLGIDDRLQAASRQSVWIHLFALYLMLEKHMPLPEVFNAMKVLLDRGVRLEDLSLTLPESVGTVTIVDVMKAGSEEEHWFLIDAWNRSAWEAWSHHHEMVSGFYSRIKK